MFDHLLKRDLANWRKVLLWASACQDCKQVLEGTSAKRTAPVSIPPSLTLGAEIFYFHDSYYRGLIGRTLVWTRALSAMEVAKMAGGR